MLDLLLAAVLTSGGYDGGRLLCTLQDRRIAESSGLVTSSRDDGLLFTHNDSGDVARFFQLDQSCRTTATFVLPRVQARDWEDISRGPGRTLWLGDIGDNSASRKLGLLVHKVTEPGRATGTVRLTPTTYRLRYPDGPHDAEALLVHPRTGQLLIVTKGLAGGVVYAAPKQLRVGVPNVLQRRGRVVIPEVTAGDISPDGSRVVLRSYSAAYEWDVSGDDVAAAFNKKPALIPLPSAPQGEGISYSRDGESLLVSSEGVGAPVQELRRAAVATSTPQPVAVPLRAGRHLGRWGVGAGVLALLAGMAGFGIRRARR